MSAFKYGRPHYTAFDKQKQPIPQIADVHCRRGENVEKQHPRYVLLYMSGQYMQHDYTYLNNDITRFNTHEIISYIDMTRKRLLFMFPP